MALNIEFPESMEFLLTEPALYKVLWGGRGAGKTLNMARAIVIFCIQKRLRVVCLREFQNSVDESVKAEIENNIRDMTLEDEFEIQDKLIISKRTGAEIIFGKGLRYNIDSLKSMSRIDLAWVDEAHNVSKNSWMKLEPTIRGMAEDNPEGMGGPFGEGPEIWVSFNPELETDETYKRYIVRAPPEWVTDSKTGKKIRYSIIKKVNYWDNKWFPRDLRLKMETMKAENPNEYLEVYEGHTKVVLEGAIYADEIRAVLSDNPPRRGKVPYDPNRPVHTYWDLGRSDKTAIWFIQNVGMEFNVIKYYENRLKKMPFYIKYLQEQSYVYGVHNLPHDGDAETLSNITPKKQLSDALIGKVKIIERPTKKFIGINAGRSVFPLCNFDEENTSDGWQCLTHYCYKVDDAGVFSKEPDHDTPWSHGADGWQTFGLSTKTETATKKHSKPEERVLRFPSPTSWMQ